MSDMREPDENPGAEAPEVSQVFEPDEDVDSVGVPDHDLLGLSRVTPMTSRTWRPSPSRTVGDDGHVNLPKTLRTWAQRPSGRSSCDRRTPATW